MTKPQRTHESSLSSDGRSGEVLDPKPRTHIACGGTTAPVTNNTTTVPKSRTGFGGNASIRRYQLTTDFKYPAGP
jgi:hypothetical protein